MLDVKLDMQKQNDQARFTVTRRADDDAAKAGAEQTTVSLDEETSLTPRGTLLTTKSHVSRKRKAGSKATVAAALTADAAVRAPTSQQPQQLQQRSSLSERAAGNADAVVPALKGFDDYEFSDDEADSSNKRKLQFKIHSPRSMRNKAQNESPLSASTNSDNDIIGLSPPSAVAADKVRARRARGNTGTAVKSTTTATAAATSTSNATQKNSNDDDYYLSPPKMSTKSNRRTTVCFC
jgi:hypothetical protein